jgi:Ca-activated chloride channel family protein
MFRFENPEFLYILILIPVMIIFFIVDVKRRKKMIEKIGDPQIVKGLMPDFSEGRHRFKFWLVIFILAFMSVLLAQPQMGSKLEEVKREGVEIMIALDVSNSMKARDIKPNRIERAKQAIASLVGRLKNDRIGLIVFAGDAYIQLPITTDYVSAKMFLSSINTNVVPRQGTAIGSAINLASKSFSPDPESNKVIIVITDGENHQGNAIEASKAASEKGITVYTIGMGLPKGAPIPIAEGDNEFQRNKEGEVVISKLDEDMLNKIAINGGGRYIPANNARVGLNALFDEINKLEKTEFETKIYTAYDEKFQIIAGIVLFILLLELLVMERKNKWLKKVKLFK